MWWLVLGIALVGALIYIGCMIERERIEAQTDAAELEIRESVKNAKCEVAGMDDAELRQSIRALERGLKQ